MKAAVLHQLGRLDIDSVELDGPRADEVRVRTSATGLCHSDYHWVTGALPIPFPAVLGHEAAGVVEAVGADVSEFAPGDFVVTCASSYCGHCRECQRGYSNRCDAKPNRPDTPQAARLKLKGAPVYQAGRIGGFAEEMVVHRTSLVKIPQGVPPTSAALLGCAVLTGAGAALNSARVEPGSTVAVIGCGGVGLNTVQGAKIAGAGRIIAIDLNPRKLEHARTFGATDTLKASADTVAEIVEMTNGGVDYAFEVIGLPATMREACLMLRKGGTAALVGVAKEGAELTVPIQPFAWKEIRVVGSLMGSVPFQIFLPRLAQYYLNGSLKLDELVSQRLPLADINRGFADMASGAAIRSVVVF